MKITKATEKDWKEYKEIRLEALKNNPEAFGASYEDEAKRSGARWKKSLKDKNKTVFLVLDNNKPVAISMILFESSKRFDHIARISSVYVNPEYRGRKLSSKLMELIIKEAKRKKIMKIQLKVVTSQESAIALYKKFGFKVVAKLNKEMKIGNKYYDEYLMEREL